MSSTNDLRGLYCVVCSTGEWTSPIWAVPQITDRWSGHIEAGHIVMALTTAEYESVFGPPRARVLAVKAWLVGSLIRYGVVVAITVLWTWWS